MPENHEFNILIIDDVPKNIQVAANFLQNNGYRVSFATSGDDALRVLKKNSIDLILLDVVMPDIDGFEVCKEIKSYHDFSQIPIIFLTIKTDTDSIIKGFEMGGVDYVTKPFNTYELLARVKTHLHLSHLQNNLQILVDKKTEELIKLNSELKSRVEEEIEKNRQHELAFITQSRFNAIGEMLHAIAHHWRQPLSIISLNIQNIQIMYKEGELDEDDFNKYIDNAVKTISELSKTIDCFRNFFLPKDERKVFNIVENINQSIELIHAQFDINNIKINFDYDKEYMVDGFPNQIKQSILNIINNAKDAISIIQKENETFRGIIKISVRNKKDKVVIEIFNNGGKIKDNILDKIFNPYFTTKFKAQGVGLSLYMTKIMIEKNMNGTIDVKNIDSGVIFTIKLNENTI